MFVPRQQYPRELKIAVMREIDSGKNTAWVVKRTCTSKLSNMLGTQEKRETPWGLPLPISFLLFVIIVRT